MYVCEYRASLANKDGLNVFVCLTATLHLVAIVKRSSKSNNNNSNIQQGKHVVGLNEKLFKTYPCLQNDDSNVKENDGFTSNV